MSLTASFFFLVAAAQGVDPEALSQRLAGELSIEQVNQCTAIHLYDERRLAAAMAEAEGDRLARMAEAQSTQDLLRGLWVSALRLEIERAADSENPAALANDLRAAAQALIAGYEQAEDGTERLKTARRACTNSLQDAIRAMG